MNMELMEDRSQIYDVIERLIIEKASTNDTIQILEAGCGSSWPFKLEGIQYSLTGVDIDKSALELRKRNFGDLNEIIEGDLCSVDLGVAKYDVIYCSFVLEHIEKADLVMQNFVKWAKPNALIFINVPDPHTVEGFVTRITPHWFHIWFYRVVLANKNAGNPGYGPYPTYYHPIISSRGMREFCCDETNAFVLEAEYGNLYVRQGRRATKLLIQIVMKVINLLSFGSLSDGHTNLFYILRNNRARDDLMQSRDA